MGESENGKGLWTPLAFCFGARANVREGFVDYVLWGDDGKPLALVEAKATRHGSVSACANLSGRPRFGCAIGGFWLGAGWMRCMAWGSSAVSERGSVAKLVDRPVRLKFAGNGFSGPAGDDRVQGQSF
jgi:hypothetical protein